METDLAAHRGALAEILKNADTRLDGIGADAPLEEIMVAFRDTFVRPALLALAPEMEDTLDVAAGRSRSAKESLADIRETAAGLEGAAAFASLCDRRTKGQLVFDRPASAQILTLYSAFGDKKVALFSLFCHISCMNSDDIGDNSPQNGADRPSIRYRLRTMPGGRFPEPEEPRHERKKRTIYVDVNVYEAFKKAAYAREMSVSEALERMMVSAVEELQEDKATVARS